MEATKDYTHESICTVNQMAGKLKLSRARFYQLVNAGVFPPPAYCCLNRKPLYPNRLQKACFQIRKTGIGLNGQPIRFYSSRKNMTHKPEHKQITGILREMGLSVTVGQVRKAIRQLRMSITCEESIDEKNIRKLFEHLCGGCPKSV